MEFNFAWDWLGLGGLIFGLSLRYIGESVGQSIALGICSSFATLLPAAMMGDDLFTGPGLILLLLVGVGIAGVFVLAFAFSLKDKQLSAAQKKTAIEDYSYGEGVFIAILSGLMSACFGLGLACSEPIRLNAIALGANPMFAGLPSILMITLGGFLVNGFFSIYQNITNKTSYDYFNTTLKVFIRNLILCALSGGLWYFQFFGLTIGKYFLIESSVMLAFSWSILMAFNISFSTIVTVFRQNWFSFYLKPFVIVVFGLLVIFTSIFISTLY